MMILGEKKKNGLAALSAKYKLEKSLKLCPEYNKDLKTRTSRDFESMERVTGPGREQGVPAHHAVSFIRSL